MYDETQFIRGSLEGCILKIIGQHMTYGYEILMDTKEVDWIDVTERTLYPVLLRLGKLYYIRAEKRGSSLGPRHRYYQITAEGRVYFRDSYMEWSKLIETIDKLFEEDVNDDRQ